MISPTSGRVYKRWSECMTVGRERSIAHYIWAIIVQVLLILSQISHIRRRHVGESLSTHGQFILHFPPSEPVYGAFSKNYKTIETFFHYRTHKLHQIILENTILRIRMSQYVLYLRLIDKESALKCIQCESRYSIIIIHFWIFARLFILLSHLHLSLEKFFHSFLLSSAIKGLLKLCRNFFLRIIKCRLDPRILNAWRACQTWRKLDSS
jgi:hypothetical protein